MSNVETRPLLYYYTFSIEEKMKYKKLILIPVLFFCCLTFLQAQKSLKGIEIEEVLAIGETSEDLLYQRPGLTTDNEENVYVTDLKDNSIKKFNKNGELLNETLTKGGKKELQGPSLIKYYNGKLYVSEIYSPGILVFDEDLNFELKIPLRFTVADFNFISQDQIAVSALIYDWFEGDFVSCIYFYDIEGNESEEEKITYSTEKKFTMMNMTNFVIDRRKDFYIVYSWKDRIEGFERNGESLWTNSLLDERSVKTRSKKGSKQTFDEYPVEIVYKGIDLDKHGHIFILGGHLSENPCRDVYVLNMNGEHLTTFTLPESSNAIHIDRSNYLYSRSDKGVTLKKYLVKYIYE